MKETPAITPQEAADELQYICNGLKRYNMKIGSKDGKFTNNTPLDGLINDISKLINRCEEFCDD